MVGRANGAKQSLTRRGIDICYVLPHGTDVEKGRVTLHMPPRQLNSIRVLTYHNVKITPVLSVS